jgi:hypothetical protein
MTAEDFYETMRRQVAERPRVVFICERDLMWGPNTWAIGLAWHRNFKAMPGEHIYQRRLILRIDFKVRLENSKPPVNQ